jgi:hypothetical protein
MVKGCSWKGKGQREVERASKGGKVKGSDGAGRWRRNPKQMSPRLQTKYLQSQKGKINKIKK